MMQVLTGIGSLVVQEGNPLLHRDRANLWRRRCHRRQKRHEELVDGTPHLFAACWILAPCWLVAQVA